MSHSNRFTLRHRPLLSSLFSTALIFNPVIGSAEELVLEEVLVTAQKQTQNLQETPVTVNAISADTYNEMASFDLKDIDRLTAGVDISGDSFSIDFKVRGIGTNLDSGAPSRVTLYKDGAFTNQQRAIFLSQFDLERFELLRGPQGTLYGKASPAGSLVIHTKEPSLTKQDGYVQISAFSRDGSNTQFGVSQPLIADKLGLRLSGVFDQNSNADIHNETLNEDAIDRTSAGRATLKWLINDRLDARVSYNYTENSSDFITITAPGSNKAEDRKSFDDRIGTLEIRDKHVIAEMNYAMTDDITITGVTFYQELLTERFYDGDSTSSAPALDRTQNVKSNIGKVLNSELRIHNTVNDNWKWITGVYYSHSNAKTDVADITRFNSPFSGTRDFRLTPRNSTEDWALFHHSGIQINEDDVLTIGIRYNDTRVNASSPFVDTTFAGSTPVAVNSGQGIPLDNEKRRFQEFTGTIKYQHNFNDDTTGYVSWDRGWRPASATVDASGNVPDELILHDDEPSTNYEIGLKGMFWDGRAQYNLAAYRQLYQSFQFQADGIFVDTQGDGNAIGGTGRPDTFNAVVNADKVVTTGFEGELTALLSPNWKAFMSVAVNDVKFDKFDNAPCNSGGTASVPVNSYNQCDLSGQRATEAPNLSAIASSEYSLPLKGHAAEWYLRGLVKYENERYFRSIEANPPKPGDDLQDAYTIVDVFTGVRSNDGQWDVSLWVKNATDETVIEGFDVTATGATVLDVNDPLTAGITGTWRFGLAD